ncbi:hypothetical protein H0H92_000667 [Tricholoma furcatifolium]|nr:hypothetical protein H0H92_000667 [Tricholoma furcatifolium]
MFHIIAVVAGVLPLVAFAQYGPSPAASPTNSAAAVVPSAPPNTPGQINVDVAFQETYTFNPSNFTAPNGTQVTFYFPKSAPFFSHNPDIDDGLSSNGINHSVTQSSFAEPCTYLAATGNNSAGFDSGLQSAVTFSITIVDDSKPLPTVLGKVLHCGMGMVGAINAPTTGNTFDAFKAAALKIGNSEVTETGGPVTGGVAGVATALPVADIGGASLGTPSPSGISGASTSTSPNIAGASSTGSPASSNTTSDGASSSIGQMTLQSWTSVVVVIEACFSSP